MLAILLPNQIIYAPKISKIETNSHLAIIVLFWQLKIKEKISFRQKEEVLQDLKASKKECKPLNKSTCQQILKEVFCEIRSNNKH